MLPSPLTPDLVWGLLPRLLGLAFVIAFVSLSRQVVPLVGSRGVSPLHHRLARLRRDVPAPRRWFEAPTLFWFGHGDATLATLPWVGVVGGAFAMLGGPLGWWGLLLCWLCYLSLDVVGLWLPWDTLLLEAGFLALFLPATALLPDLHAVEPPLASVAFMQRWLVIRLMWGFAKLKFWGTEKGDGLYLRGFLTWLPMPTPAGWLAQKAPAWALRLGCAFMFVAEVVAPLLAWFPQTRVLGAALLVALMIGIQATGNWGHFNIAYAGLCVVLLDTTSTLSDLWASDWTAAPDVFVHATMGVLFVASVALFPLNSWVTQAALQWNTDRFTWGRPWLTRLLDAARRFNRLRLVGAYGVFPPNTSPPIKMVPVMESSHDGQTWTPIPWRFMPVGEHSPPRFIAPHHPRLDHSCIYVGLGLNESDPVGGLMFEVKPYGGSPYSQHSWLQRVVQRVLEGEPGVLSLLGKNPFPDGPPTWVRVVHQCLRPGSTERRTRCGKWWHARAMSVLHEPVRSDPSLWEHWIAEPEGVHPELSHWRRASPTLARVRDAVHGALVSSVGGYDGRVRTDVDTCERASGAGAPVDPGVRAAARAALCAASPLTVEDVDAFWDEYVPWVADPSRRDRWDCLAHTHSAMGARFGVERLRVFERIHQRAAHVLEARVEPHLYGGVEPVARADSPFHVQAALAALVLDGEDAWLDGWLRPGPAMQRALARDEAGLLFPTGLFRWELTRFVVLSLQARVELSRAPEMLWGIGRHQDFLKRVDAGPRWAPECVKSASGEWTVPVEPFEAGDGPPSAPGDAASEDDPVRPQVAEPVGPGARSELTAGR